MLPIRLMATVFLVAVLGYLALGWATFTVPVSLELGEACGFTSDDFNAAGQITYAPIQAWFVSFMRKQEYFSAISIGLTFAFMAFVLSKARLIGVGMASGAAAGGGLLALAALCLGCLTPALSLVGLGLASAAMAGVPKWMMAVNTLILTGWGTLYLSRKLNVCPVMPKSLTPTIEKQ